MNKVLNRLPTFLVVAIVVIAMAFACSCFVFGNEITKWAHSVFH